MNGTAATEQGGGERAWDRVRRTWRMVRRALTAPAPAEDAYRRMLARERAAAAMGRSDALDGTPARGRRLFAQPRDREAYERAYRAAIGAPAGRSRKHAGRNTRGRNREQVQA